MQKVFVDISPLRLYPKFRRMWIGAAVSSIGNQLSIVAIAYEIYHLTRSNLDVGLISLVQLLPALVGSLVGGAIADAVDRQKLLIGTGITLAVLASVMGLDVRLAHPSIGLLYVLAAVSALIQGCNNPAQSSVLLTLVDRDVLLKAYALRQLLNQIATVLGPTAAGLLIASFGTSTVFFANAMSFLVAVGAVLTVGSRQPQGGGTRFGLRSITEGFSFLRGRHAIQGCLIADLNAMVLGMPTAVFPALAITHFHGGPRILGLLYAAPGIGAVVGASLSGWTNRIRRLGMAILVSGIGWGLALVAFGLMPWVIPAVIFLAIAGAADIIASIFRGTIIQSETPDRLRGRLTSIQTAVVTSGPRLGNTEAGLVAALTNAQFSIVSGGIGCILGVGLLARFLPNFLHYKLSDEALSTINA